MQSLERAFGKELNKNIIGQLVGRPVGIRNQSTKVNGNNLNRNTSFHRHETKHQNIQPNVSQPINKNKFTEPIITSSTPQSNLTQYFDECLSFMLHQERQLQSSSLNYEITRGMRTILLDWAVDVHLKYKMFPQTLFIMACIFDKYLSIKCVKKDELQLFGAASLLVAAKYEETYQVPEIIDLINICGKIFTKRDLLKMQGDIVKTLNFDLIFTTSFNFLQSFSSLIQLDTKKMHLCQYVIQLALLDGRFDKYKPSLVASSSLYLVHKIKKQQTAWPDVMVAASGYQQKQLRSCARQLCQLLQQAETIPQMKFLRRKFSLAKFSEVAKIRLEKRQKNQ